jgi:lysyl-tRNA synthetase class I
MKDIVKRRVQMIEKFTKEVVEVMSKEELQEAVLTLQLKLETAEKEIERLKAEAEIGKKYIEYLRAEAKRLINLVHKESPILKLVDNADVDTLKQIIDDFSKKAKEIYKPSSTSATYTQKEPLQLTKEDLMKMSYKDLLKLAETFKTKEVQ